MAEENDGSDQPCTVPQHTISMPSNGAVPSEGNGDRDLQTPFVLLPATDPRESCDNDFHHGNTPTPRGMAPRTEWSTLSLPDLDDTSMKYVVLYMEHYKVDLRWSVISNSIFIIGGVCYVVLTAWD